MTDILAIIVLGLTCFGLGSGRSESDQIIWNIT